MAETITSEVVGNVSLPAGAPAGTAPMPRGKGFSGSSSKPFGDCDPNIQVGGSVGCGRRRGGKNGGEQEQQKQHTTTTASLCASLPVKTTSSLPPHQEKTTKTKRQTTQELVRNVLDLYERAPFSSSDAEAVLSRFASNAELDTPLLFARGAGRIKALSRLMALPFSRIVATPRVVTVSMVGDASARAGEAVGRIDVEGVVEYVPRASGVWPLSLVLPAALPVHSSWCITARGDDDKVMTLTERLHNVPPAPYMVRAVGATAASTAAMSVAAL